MGIVPRHLAGHLRGSRAAPPRREVASRKAHDSQLIGIRAALCGGAGWEQIAEALGVPADSARSCLNEAIAERLDADAAAAVCDLAGAPVPTVPTLGPGAPPRRGPGPAASVGAWYRKRSLNRENRRAEHVLSVVVP